jgi:two-component system, OmpR family, response regulator MtrA
VLDPAAHPARLRPHIHGKGTRVARILVADDDVDIRELVEFKLSTLGHDVVAVADGAAAIEACQAERPDLAVLDVMMPGVSGLDAIRAIRADPALADLPVILLTARAQESDVETGFDSGADDYITKPFSPRELASRVQALLTRSTS